MSSALDRALAEEITYHEEDEPGYRVEQHTLRGIPVGWVRYLGDWPVDAGPGQWRKQR